MVPILVPLLAGALLLVIDEPRHALKASVSVAAMLLLLLAAGALAARADAAVTHVYSLGAWAAPIGIVLVADRLAALMVLLTALLGLAALLFALARWHRAGPQFHSLLQFLLAGLNGAFLTVISSTCSCSSSCCWPPRTAWRCMAAERRGCAPSLHYIVINLAASLLFLVGVSLLYGMAGTLNMADLAVRLPKLPAEDRPLLEVGAAMLAVAFLVKAGMWPLGFWLPAHVRVQQRAGGRALLHPEQGGHLCPGARLVRRFRRGAGRGADRLWRHGDAGVRHGGHARLPGPRPHRELQPGRRRPARCWRPSASAACPAIAPALFYLVTSTLGSAALFLLVELVERSRAPGANLLAVTADAFGVDGEEDDSRRSSSVC